MAIVTGRSLGVELCEALGVKPENVAKITIIAAAEDASRVEIEHFLTDDFGVRVRKVLSRYVLADPDLPPP